MIKTWGHIRKKHGGGTEHLELCENLYKAIKENFPGGPPFAYISEIKRWYPNTPKELYDRYSMIYIPLKFKFGQAGEAELVKVFANKESTVNGHQ